MAFEDAATLALTLSQLYKPNPMPNVHTTASISDRMTLLERWYKHRKAIVDKVHALTAHNAEMMKSSSWLQQLAREWASGLC